MTRYWLIKVEIKCANPAVPILCYMTHLMISAFCMIDPNITKRWNLAQSINMKMVIGKTNMKVQLSKLLLRKHCVHSQYIKKKKLHLKVNAIYDIVFVPTMKFMSGLKLFKF